MREPLLDIVMLVHDQAGWADLAIRAVEHLTKTPYRLIIVDNASELPETKILLSQAENRGHTIVHLKENRSFSNGVNAGVQIGSAKFICVLNDDAIVTEGWDAALIQDAGEKDVGLVGARSNFASGAQMDPAFVGEPPYLVFVCVALRRQVWNAVGPLDEVTFDGFSSEDLDYSWRVVKAGYKLKVSSAFVLHAGSRTLVSTLGNDASAHQRNNAKYNARLLDKWGKDWVREHSRLRQRVLVCRFSPNRWVDESFLEAFINLKAFGGYEFAFTKATRAPIQMARNLAADYAVAQEFDVLVMLDDDATFPPDTIRRLLSHGKDQVIALAYQRKPPHMTCCFELGDDGLLGKPMEGIEHTGLRRIDTGGLHVSATRVSVFKTLKAHGITRFFGGFDNKVGEDFAFHLNLKKAGILAYCDTELIAGHIGDPIVVDESYKRNWVQKTA